MRTIARVPRHSSEVRLRHPKMQRTPARTGRVLERVEELAAVMDLPVVDDDVPIDKPLLAREGPGQRVARDDRFDHAASFTPAEANLFGHLTRGLRSKLQTVNKADRGPGFFGPLAYVCC